MDGAETIHQTVTFVLFFWAYQKNTGEAHFLASKVPAGHSNKRPSGSGGVVAVFLSDYLDAMWYSYIVVGTPATSYTGLSPFFFFSVEQTK